MLLAQGRFPAPTEPARPARDVEGHHDALAGSNAAYVVADRLHHADGLVPEDGARFDRRLAMEEVEVRSADRRPRHPHDRVGRTFDDRRRDVGDLHPATVGEHDRAHATPRPGTPCPPHR